MTEYEEPYLHWLPEEDADTKIELGLIRMMNENRKIALSAKVLSRVQLSEVVSGEWYWVGDFGDKELCQCISDGTFWSANGYSVRPNECVDEPKIWGPLPKFKLEGEE